MIECLHLLEPLVLFVEVFPLVWVHARLLPRFLLMTAENFPEQLTNKVHFLQSVINVHTVNREWSGYKEFLSRAKICVMVVITLTHSRHRHSVEVVNEQCNCCLWSWVVSDPSSKCISESLKHSVTCRSHICHLLVGSHLPGVCKWGICKWLCPAAPGCSFTPYSCSSQATLFFPRTTVAVKQKLQNPSTKLELWMRGNQ